MNIQSSLRQPGNLSHLTSTVNSRPSSPAEPERQIGDEYVASESSEFGARVLGGFVGAVVGGIGGSAGSQSALLASGLGAGIATTATLGPHLSKAVKSGLNGDPINDVALTTSAVFAGGVTLSALRWVLRRVLRSGSGTNRGYALRAPWR